MGRSRGRPPVSGRSKVSIRTTWRPPPITAAQSSSDDSVRVETDMDTMLTQIVQGAAEKGALAASKAAEQVFQDLARRWPHPGSDTSGRSTGYSISKLSLTMDAGDELEIRFRNEAEYAGLIVQDAYGGRRVVDRLLFDRVDEIYEFIGEALADGAQRGGQGDG